MFSYRTDIAECIVRNEIKEWFKKLAHKTCGPDVQIRYLSNEAHVNTHTNVEISGTKEQINQAIVFIQDTSDILNYKMPWLSENTYYVYSDARKEMVELQMQTLKNAKYDIPYLISWLNLFGLAVQLFNFRPDLDETKKIELDAIFKSVSEPTMVFISAPKIGEPQIESSIIGKGTNMLTTFHGQFLPYLSEEDILSLEVANGGRESCYDVDLNHDIQQYLEANFPVLYDEAARVDRYNLKGYKINKVLRYFIHKYYDRFKQIDIPVILTANEIQSLSHLYNIEFLHHNRIHIDFKSTNETDHIDFCAIFHYDPNNGFFLNYGSKYATKNYSLKFNGDNSLEPLLFNSEYSSFIVKSFNNCSPQKTNSVLKCIVDHVRACKYTSELVLYEFDLNPVSREVLSSLLKKARDGWLLFDTMNFNLKTFIAILEQADRLVFRNCQFEIETIETFSNDSNIRNLRFYDMDVELNVLCILRNIEWLLLKNCRILNTKREVPNKTEISDHFKFYHTNFDTSTLLKLLNGLQCVRELTFISCDLPPCDCFDINHFKVQNVIHFINMVFSIQTLFQIFKNCEFQNFIKFENCYFPFEQAECYIQHSLKPVKVEFYNIKFDSISLFTILGTLNNGSNVRIYDSCISHFDENIDTPAKAIQIESIQFTKCQLETQTLLKVLSKMSNKTKVHIDNCELIRPSGMYPNMLVKLSKIEFKNMKLKSNDLFAFLAILKKNSSVIIRCCHVIAESEYISEISLQSKIKIEFYNMPLEIQITRLLLQTDAEVLFDNCYLHFLLDEFAIKVIQSACITFRNMTFESSTNLKSLSKVTPKSIITFSRCHFHFTNLVIPNIVISPLRIIFERTSFDLEMVVTILQKVSEQTEVVIDNCDIRPAQVFSMLNIKVQDICFKRMNLEIGTIFYILQNFNNCLTRLGFVNCKIRCSNPNDLGNTQFNFSTVVFSDMDFDAEIFQTFIQKCSIGLTVLVDNCKIIPAHSNASINDALIIERLVIKNIKYSIDLLKLFQNVNGRFIVEYHGHLSNQDIMDICTKSLVNGERFRLVSQTLKSIYFELFTEFFWALALNSNLDTNKEYELPAYLIPNINSVSCDIQYWNAFRVKYVSVNNAVEKIEYLKNGTPIELYDELNGLSHDMDLDEYGLNS